MSSDSGATVGEIRERSAARSVHNLSDGALVIAGLVREDCAKKVTRWIRDQVGRQGFVEMGVRLHGGRQQEKARKVEDSRGGGRRVKRTGWSDRGDAAVRKRNVYQAAVRKGHRTKKNVSHEISLAERACRALH